MTFSSASSTTSKKSSELTGHGQVMQGRPFFATLTRFLLIVCLACTSFGGGIAFQIYLTDIEKFKKPDFRETTHIFADNGELITEFAFERRYVVTLKEIPQILQDAFLAAEGEDFLRRPGASVNAIVRAAINVLRPKDPDLRRTIVRSMPGRTPTEDLLITIRETLRWKALTRGHALYLYLNQIYLGSGAYGVEATARTYFGKSVKDLTIAECAMIAGLVKAPSRDSPKHNMQRALERRNDVLRLMFERGKITQAEYNQAINEEPVLAAERTNPYKLHSAEFVERVRMYLVNKFGADKLYKGGLKVYTSFDLALAQATQETDLIGTSPLQQFNIKRIVDKRGNVLGDSVPSSNLPPYLGPRYWREEVNSRCVTSPAGIESAW
jgi:penicillin-binding protein 1A